MRRGSRAVGSRQSAVGSRGTEAVAEIRSYRDLRVWQEAMTLVEDCYRFSKELPREELFGLTSQIRRAAVSIPANIAEGYGRDSKGSYVSFLKTAQGSLKELETHLILASSASNWGGSTELNRFSLIVRRSGECCADSFVTCKLRRRNEMKSLHSSQPPIDCRLPTADCRSPACGRTS
jgi:four helix bundle protein